MAREADRRGGAAVGLGAGILLACCAAHLAAAGALGGLAVGGLFGVGAGVAVAAVLVGAALVIRRRRHSRCEPSDGRGRP